MNTKLEATHAMKTNLEGDTRHEYKVGGVTSHLATRKTRHQQTRHQYEISYYIKSKPNKIFIVSIDQLARFPLFKTFRISIRTIIASFPLSDCNIHMLFGKTICRFCKQAMDNFTWMVLNHVRLPPLTHFTRHK